MTLLLADIENSTQHWQSESDAMRDAVEQLNRTLSDLAAQHGGVRPPDQGESFVVAFARASDAVEVALRLQLATPSPISLRIGLHTGEVQLRDRTNYIGPAIIRAARLRDLAHGGQTVLSAATSDLLADGLPTAASLRDLGVHSLRDLPRPERVTQLCHPLLRNDFPQLRSPKTSGKQHLPPQLTNFVGRGAEIEAVRKLFSDNRLVTLTGAGGVGKTRLAVQVAARLDNEFGDGVWYVDLASIADPDVMPVAVTRALGLPDQAGRSMMDTLTRAVGARHLLIVLDNCEHLIEASAALTVALLETCPALTVLATSREPLRVSGEVAWQVPSLSLADESVALFTDRARQVRADFVADEANSAAVAEICRRLDGMPLAIELAAARVRMLSVTQILDGLHERFRLLTGGARTTVRRHQTLRASVDWSHDLLTDPERVMLRRLGVFLGGFDFDAAQAVSGEGHRTLDLLASLIDKSLVVAEDHRLGTRYRMLETIRQYALEKLDESGEAHEVHVRHRDHYRELATELDTAGRTDRQRWVDLAELDIDNLRAAFAWSRADDTRGALQLASALQPVWLTRGRVREGTTWFEAALADARIRGVELSPAVRGRALADRAVLDAAQQNHDNMAAAHEALAIARELDDPALLLRALIGCGGLSAFDASSASAYFDEALGLARTLGDDWSLSQILGYQTFAAATGRGDANAALAAGEEGQRVADAIGDGYNSRMSRWGVALVKSWRGELADAIELSRELVSESEAAHDEIQRMASLLSLGHLYAYVGDGDSARAAATAALDAATDLGSFNQGFAYAALAVAHLAAGDVEASAKAGETAQQLMSVQPELAVVNVIPLAQVALARGDVDTARRWADDAIAVAPGAHLMLALATRARVALTQGDSAQAERDAHEALKLAVEFRGHLVVPDVLECLAALAGPTSAAVRLYSAAETTRHQIGRARFQAYQPGHDAALKALRESLGDSTFDEAWSAGASLSTDAAIAYAQRGRGDRKRPAVGWASLTPAELSVVRLVADGLPNKDIADRLFVSPRTVQAHLNHVYAKLGLSSRVQLAQESARHA